MSDHLIIALNREYGSGGKEIAEKLGKRLGLKVYDEDIADLAARRSGIRKDYFEKVDEKPTDSFLYMLAMNTFTMNTSMNPFENTLSSDKLFNKQAEVIQEIADKDDCIIVGRSASGSTSVQTRISERSASWLRIIWMRRKHRRRFIPWTRSVTAILAIMQDRIGRRAIHMICRSAPVPLALTRQWILSVSTLISSLSKLPFTFYEKRAIITLS